MGPPRTANQFDTGNTFEWSVSSGIIKHWTPSWAHEPETGFQRSQYLSNICAQLISCYPEGNPLQVVATPSSQLRMLAWVCRFEAEASDLQAQCFSPFRELLRVSGECGFSWDSGVGPENCLGYIWMCSACLKIPFQAEPPDVPEDYFESLSLNKPTIRSPAPGASGWLSR